MEEKVAYQSYERARDIQVKRLSSHIRQWGLTAYMFMWQDFSVGVELPLKAPDNLNSKSEVFLLIRFKH